MTISIFSLVAPAFVLLVFKEYNTALVFAIISTISSTYTVKIIPFVKNHQLKLISLKDIPIGKNIVVCVIWAGSALAIAASFLDIKSYTTDLVILFITFFIGNCNSTITSDARDVIGDQMRDIKTLPGIFGLKNTFKILTAINVIGLVLIVVSYNLEFISLKLTLLTTIIILWAGLSTIPQYFFPQKISKTTVELLVDSHLLISALGLILIGYLF